MEFHVVDDVCGSKPPPLHVVNDARRCHSMSLTMCDPLPLTRSYDVILATDDMVRDFTLQ
eukprot:2075711-Karenia_brevis.AAC.1